MRRVSNLSMMLRELEQHCRRRTIPPEVQRLGRTLHASFDRSPVSTWPGCPTVPPKRSTTFKRIKRIGFGFRNSENYRIRALLYAGKPNWRVLGSIVVR
jgi:transposase